MAGGCVTESPRQLRIVCVSDEWRETLRGALESCRHLLNVAIDALGADQHSAIWTLRDDVMKLMAHLAGAAQLFDEAREIPFAVEQLSLVKGAAIVHLGAMRRSLARLETEQGTSADRLGAAAQKLAKLESIVGSAPLARVRPNDELLAHAVFNVPFSGDAEVPDELLDIADTELKRRCGGVYADIMASREYDRLDSVLVIATTVLEHRLREACGADSSRNGVDLATYAFGGAAKARIRLSSNPAEQEAGHQLWRGVFGSIRNSAHHRLLGVLDPRRVRQAIGFIDRQLGELADVVTAASGVPELAAG